MPSLLGFLEAAESLKWIPRSGWLKAGIDKSESVADHSFGCAILAMIFGDTKGLDSDRMIRMALLHDLHESLVGDMTPRDKRSAKEPFDQIETEARKELLSELPKRLKRKYARLIFEYQNQTSREAILVKELDNLEMALQALQYRRRQYSTNKLHPFLRSSAMNIRDRALRSLLSTAKRRVNVSTNIKTE